MRSWSVVLGAVLIVLVPVASILGLGANHPKDYRVTDQDGWPKGLAALVNDSSRVHGFFINANDFFFYSGNSEAFNVFMERYAKLTDIPLVLVLHPGVGRTGGLGEEKNIPCEWAMSIIRRGWGADMPKEFEKSPSKVLVNISLHLGGKVRLDELDVPLNVKVRSGGEIDQFIATHEAKQSLLDKPAK